MFRLLALGVGDAFSALYYSSCFAVQADGVWLLVDCPHPIRKILREASQTAGIALDVKDIHAIALTHLHADHCTGLEDFAYYSHFVLNRRTQLAVHPEVSNRLWEGCLAAGMEWLMPSVGVPLEPRHLNDYFDLIPLSHTSTTQVGPFRIQCRKTIHSVPTMALRIEAEGRCLGYSADTAWDGSLITWLSSADLIVHETNFGIHTPYEKLAALPAELRAKMRLIHYHDTFDRDASVIEALRPGRLYDI